MGTQLFFWFIKVDALYVEDGFYEWSDVENARGSAEHDMAGGGGGSSSHVFMETKKL